MKVINIVLLLFFESVKFNFNSNVNTFAKSIESFNIRVDVEIGYAGVTHPYVG